MNAVKKLALVAFCLMATGGFGAPISVAANGGVPVYCATDGGYYYLDVEFSETKPWRKVIDRTKSSAEVAGRVLIDDMFDDPRVRSGRARITYGPVNADSAGLTLLVR